MTIVLAWAGEGRGAWPPAGTLYYSTAPAPRDYDGPRPVLLALNEPTSSRADIEAAVDRQVLRAQEVRPAPAPASASPAPEPSGVPRVASALGHGATPAPTPGAAAADPITLARRAVADCQARFRQVHDYTCTFHKRERINGRLTSPHIMAMKARTEPTSVYFKFQAPNKGREAIYVAGRNGGRILAHDVGFGKLLAGTMRLDPKGTMAMEENRHPVTEAGIGHMLDTIARHWAFELSPGESLVSFHHDVRVDNRPCTMIETIHPRKNPEFLFHAVKLYIDHELGLPIRFEAYDWPKHPGSAPELVEEYTYRNLRVNVGLRDQDFDPSNAQYSFGRF